KPIFGDIFFNDGTIKEIIPQNFKNYRPSKNKSKNIYDAGGRVLTIPNVNFHDHIYSRLAKGLPIKGKMDNFHNILKNLWWKLDVQLDNEITKASAQYAAINSIKNGVTYIFDHHSAPNASNKSLCTIGKVLKDFNIRGVLAFETTDRNGKEKSQKGFEENLNFIQNLSDQDIKSMFGLHASFTLNDKTLRSIGEFISENNSGIHVHLCEDNVDREISKKKFGKYPLKRLIDFNLINEKSILSHSIHLTKNEIKQIENLGCAVAVNIDSNLNNAVGLTKVTEFNKAIPVITGTDGMHSNPTKTLKNLFLSLRNIGVSFDKAFEIIIKIFFDQIYFVKRYFPNFTSLKPNDRADFIVWDYIPPTPINSENFWGHYIYGITESNIYGTFQNGKSLMWNKQIENINEEKIFNEISKEGYRLFNKMKRVK
ncbi:MAG: amidohydrolase family protein, partial [Ignavibacteriae bacterium]|nr:amidohydrolase family protein [Ignavibacteriota bacterium]